MAIDFAADHDGASSLLSLSQAQESRSTPPQTPITEAIPIPMCRNHDPSPEVLYGPRVVFQPSIPQVPLADAAAATAREVSNAIQDARTHG